MSKTFRLFVFILLVVSLVSAQSLDIGGLDRELLALPALLTLVLVYAMRGSSIDRRLTRDDMRVRKPDLSRSSPDIDEEEKETVCSVCNTECETEEDKILHEQALH